jgi:hypothetical protein
MTNETQIVLKEDKQIEAELRTRMESISVVDVVDAETFERAAETKKAIVAIEKSWKEYWEPIRLAARSVVDMILEKRDTPLGILAKKKEALIANAKKWADEQERVRLEAERKAQEAERKRAEDEAIRIAADLEKTGDVAAAAQVLSDPIPVAQVVVKSAVPQGHGGMTQKYYSAEVKDIRALMRAVLEGKVPVTSVVGNETFLNAQARLCKSTETLNYPGVVVKSR